MPSVTSLGARLKKAILLGTGSFLLLLVFLADIIRRTVDIELGWLTAVRDVFILAAFVVFTLLIELLWQREQGPAKKIGFALVVSLVVAAASGILYIVSPSGFDAKNLALIPLGFDSIVWSNIYGVVYGMTMLVILLILRDIVYSRRRKGTQRNFLIFLGLAVATALSTLTARPLESSTLTSILFVLTVVAMIANAIRLSWIVYLSKREKLFNVVYGLLLFGIFIGFDFLVAKSSEVGKALLFYSAPLRSFVGSVSLFSTIYFGMTFISTLFHLPTAEAFDRKRSEVSSLHNLSRLVTQVFDFNELVDSVTTMTLEVCEAKSSWLEIIPDPGPAPKGLLPGHRPDNAPRTVGRRNISDAESDAIMASDGAVLRQAALESRRPVLVDNVRTDRRTAQLPGLEHKFGSMAVVPLVSHDAVIGILYATKELEFGFDRDDIEVISAFADQATIAIENSRLIEKSLERERLMREMMLAQDLQRKLLPQEVPALAEVDIEALSTPAFEVGGDYYDFILLDESHLGILVGDVSGKGVSAAFYMAEMKGIFQSLSRIYREPRAFLARAHEALIGTIDKRSFISLIYAVIDLRTGVMTIARAGHCPMLLVSDHRTEYVKPVGLGLGMGGRDFFEQTITQEERKLGFGDIAVLYTDGVTEAHPKNGPEFGYEGLEEALKSAGGREDGASPTALGVRDAIIAAVDRHMNHEPPEDDLTLVVVKWRKSGHPQVVSSSEQSV